MGLFRDVEGETRVGVFAAGSIRVGEPLTYDYRYISKLHFHSCPPSVIN